MHCYVWRHTIPLNRRRLLQLSGFGVLAAAFPSIVNRALALPANNATRSIRDVEHIVFLMQENRSFDHYFGSLRGVRGFADPRAAKLSTGRSVFHQPHETGEVLPFHPEAPELGLQFLEDLAHDWTSTHRAWNGGAYDQWVAEKGPVTMAHLTRDDIPYHYALADAFTVCDAYHCSLLGPTDPNRYHMFSGWVGNDGLGGGPIVDNAEAGYTWTTFPERLEKAGISWNVYQDIGAGLTAANSWGDGKDPYIGNYGDNSLLFFKQYREAGLKHPLHEKAKTGTNIAQGGTLFDHFHSDVAAGKLPQVSWVCAPEAYCEHPNWPANYGAWFVSQILDTLTSNPDVWSKTAFFLMFDENDGFFDHIIPPTPPTSRAEGLSTVETTNEFFPGKEKLIAGPYGLGARVPMIVISPWSKGGWVNSQVFDHTSLIRFVEARFADEYPEVREPNITPWRRSVAGDLTSAFNFLSPNDARVSLPQTAHYAPPDRKRHDDYSPKPPAVQRMPVQEPGTRPARAIPYHLEASGLLDVQKNNFEILFQNMGDAAAVFHVRSAQHIPRTYTVAPGAQLSDVWSIDAGDAGSYEISVHGPNGFFRSYGGAINDATPNMRVKATYDVHRLHIMLQITNSGEFPRSFSIHDAYSKTTQQLSSKPGAISDHSYDLTNSHGWYDLTLTSEANASFRQQFAGHLENGQPSMSDPAMGTPRESPS